MSLKIRRKPISQIKRPSEIKFLRRFFTRVSQEPFFLHQPFLPELTSHGFPSNLRTTKRESSLRKQQCFILTDFYSYVVNKPDILDCQCRAWLFIVYCSAFSITDCVNLTLDLMTSLNHLTSYHAGIRALVHTISGSGTPNEANSHILIFLQKYFGEFKYRLRESYWMK